MKPILIASIRDNDESIRARCPLVLIQFDPAYIGDNHYQWGYIDYDGDLKLDANHRPCGSIETAIANAKAIWRGPEWDLVISPASILEAIEQEWPDSCTEDNIYLLGAIKLEDRTNKGDALWSFPDADRPFWVVEGATGECVVYTDDPDFYNI